MLARTLQSKKMRTQLGRRRILVLLGIPIIFYLYTWIAKDVTFTDILLRVDISKKECTQLVEDWSKHNMSKEYYRLFPLFKSRIEAVTNNAPEVEGHTGQRPEMTKLLHMIASATTIKVVCETGFNYGHSSFNFLSANAKLEVHSFDIGIHYYASKMFKELQEIFKDRIFVHFGNSTVTIPDLKAKRELPICDLVLVDGGHTYHVAKADLLNFGSHSNPDNLVILDDYPTGWGASFGKAWDELVVKGEDVHKTRPLDLNEIKGKSHDELSKVLGIVQYVRCSIAGVGLERGFVIGKYVLKNF